MGKKNKIIQKSDKNIKNNIEKDEEKKEIFRNGIILAEKIIFLIVVVFVVGKYFFGFIRISDNSMQPYLFDGDFAIIYKKNRSYSVGDVIEYKYNGKKYILRIIAKEGQSVSISDTGTLLINGWPEARESFSKTKLSENAQINYPYTVEKGKVFVMCDNRAQDLDSRTFGAINVNDIKGKVISILRTRNI